MACLLKKRGSWPSSSKRERSMTIREEVVMAYLLEKRGSGLLVLRGKGVIPWPSSSLPESRAVEVVIAYLLEKRRSALPNPREKGRMTMATSFLSSVKSCEGGHALCHHLREKRGTALLVLRRRG